MILTPYVDCPGATEHLINEKVWLVTYVVISLGNLLRENMGKRIDKMYNDGHLTYKQRKIAKLSLWLSCELVNVVW